MLFMSFTVQNKDLTTKSTKDRKAAHETTPALTFDRKDSETYRWH
jgi:hypothetical protein